MSGWSTIISSQRIIGNIISSFDALESSISMKPYEKVKCLFKLNARFLTRNVGLITGDCMEDGELVKNGLGLDQMWANTLPEGKVNIVDSFQQEGKLVTMVGEGINDSPALAKADIGIAMGTGGTDVAIESADIVLAGDDLEKFVALIKISNHTMEVVKQNFIFAVGINALGLILG